MARLAVFFISSGRSGTQWLCDLLQSQFANDCVARHETLQSDYNIRKFLGNASAVEAASEKAAIDRHVGFINSLDETVPYIETGWTSVGVLPYLAQQLGDRFRVVQLTRHPVNTALSLSCQGMHQPEQNDRSDEWSLLDPFIDGSTYSELQADWASISAYEKCLYQWYEIHSFGETFRKTLSPDRFMHAKFEEVTDANSDCLNRVLTFCGLNGDVDLQRNQKKRIDRFPSYIPFSGDWRSVYAREKIVTLAGVLGYDFDEERLDALAARRRMTVVKKLQKGINQLRRHYRKYIRRDPF